MLLLGHGVLAGGRGARDQGGRERERAGRRDGGRGREEEDRPRSLARVENPGGKAGRAGAGSGSGWRREQTAAQELGRCIDGRGAPRGMQHDEDTGGGGRERERRTSEAAGRGLMFEWVGRGRWRSRQVGRAWSLEAAMSVSRTVRASSSRLRRGRERLELVQRACSWERVQCVRWKISCRQREIGWRTWMGKSKPARSDLLSSSTFFLALAGP